MATVAELKSQIASLEQQISVLRPALAEAETKAAQTQKALTDFQSQPPSVTITELTSARNELNADPSNPDLQQKYQLVQSKWDARQSILKPLLQARDAAFDALVAARKPIANLESQIGELEVAIANINPAEATPEANAFLAEQNQNSTPGSSSAANTSTVTTTAADGTQRTTSSSSTSTNATNPSASDAASAEKMANPQNVAGGDNLEEVEVNVTRMPVPEKPSAEPNTVTPAFAKFKNGDKRVRLIVPPSYLIGPAAGPPAGKNTTQGILNLNGGIVFPYTPKIEVSHNAEYTETAAMHSNYKQYFYKRSSVSEISLSATFTVQNYFDAAVLLAVQHLCRALTKMPYGNDPNAGSPPPVCRLMAYGDFMLDGIPVAVKSFKLDLPDDVDYFTLDNNWGYGVTSVPVKSKIDLTFVPIWSRNEMMNATVTGWLSNGLRQQGYL